MIVDYTPDRDAVRGEIFIAAPPQRVFRALTDPAEIVQWWGRPPETPRVVRWDAELRAGGKLEVRWEDKHGKTWAVDGEIKVVDPPRLLVYTWAANPGATTMSMPDFFKHPPTTVRFELEPKDAGTLVRVTHSGLKKYPEAAADYRGGWEAVLQWLRDYAAGVGAGNR